MSTHRDRAIAEFAAALRKLRERSGAPTQQVLATQMNVSRSMVAEWLSGKRLPSWPRTEAYLTTCAPELAKDPAWLENWRRHWERARDEEDAHRYGLAGPIGRGPREDIAGSGVPMATATSLLEQATTKNLTATWYRDNPEFYGAAAEYVRRAERDIRVTYIRRYPPTMFTSQAAADYFAAVLDWARDCGDQQRSVRRVIGVPTPSGAIEPAMLSWLRDHHTATADLLNYEANIFEWTVAADGVNMALLDDDIAFLAFSGVGRQRLNGFSVADHGFVDYFVNYFEQIWSASTPLEDYLRANGSQPS